MFISSPISGHNFLASQSIESSYNIHSFPTDSVNHDRRYIERERFRSARQ